MSRTGPNGPNPNARDALLRYVQFALLGSGLVLVGVYAAARLHAHNGSAAALEEFEAARRDYVTPRAAAAPAPVVPSVAEKAFLTLPDSVDPDQSEWADTRIAAYNASLRADVGAPIGVISIPDLELEAPIFEGTGALALKRGIGHIEGTAALRSDGNVGLAGHRDGFFRELKDIAIGNMINLRALTGDSQYRVTELLIVEPEDVFVLAPTDSATLTLVTCYPFYYIGSAPQRFIVKAVAVEHPDVASEAASRFRDF
jgi:sortase A